MSEPTPTPQPPRGGARKATASAGAPAASGKGAASTPSALDRAKALMATQPAPSEPDDSAKLQQRREELQDEIQTFEGAKQRLSEEFQARLQAELKEFDDEIAERQQELADIDEQLGTSPEASDTPTPPPPSNDQSGSGQPSWLATQAKSKVASFTERHPHLAKGAQRVLAGKSGSDDAPAPSADNNPRFGKGTNL